jgi:hypothetical protein
MTEAKPEAVGELCCRCKFWKLCTSIHVPDGKGTKTVFMGACRYYAPGHHGCMWPLTVESDLCSDFEERAAPQSAPCLN